jgi:alcohol dehydrogenase class IV
MKFVITINEDDIPMLVASLVAAAQLNHSDGKTEHARELIALAQKLCDQIGIAPRLPVLS